tara:strand:- start:4196 stop:4969 length:774 start_codon:yes stop_codon:yes gene_type:complete
MNKISIKHLNKLKKNNIGICSATSYDASFAKFLEDSGVDIILIGDSLGEVVQGNKDTHSVTMENMIYHTMNVARGSKKCFLVADMPKDSYITKGQALRNANKLIGKNMADMVKLEISKEDIKIVEYLIKNDIPVCAHLGIKPQKLSSKKKYKKIGKTIKENNTLINESRLIEKMGCELLILECVHHETANKITSCLSIPVIGIGSGNKCDGQIRVLYDLLGISFNGVPKFFKEHIKSPITNTLKDYVLKTKAMKKCK